MGVLIFALMAPLHPVWAQWHERTGAAMGTKIHVELWHPETKVAADLLDTVMQEMDRVDQAFSPYIEQSELSRLNRDAPSGWVVVSDEMWDLLAKSRQISELTRGAFDITYASAGRFYDYREGKAPDDATLAQTVAAIDYKHVVMDPDLQRVRYAHKAVYIDLGGIAKGHAVDSGVGLLQRGGVEQASITAGGDSRIIGDRRGEPWNVGVRDPRIDTRMAVVLPLEDTAVSTSGDYERFFERGGERFHHILDPSTGRSATGNQSVTILGPDATFTDALSTSVFVLGPEKGLTLIDRLPGIDAIVIDANGKLSYSAELLSLTQEQAR